ncbi:uncharacterized protein LOC134239334 [Saccostrea cucullata]|uniref:uncharacterized protein LOC134239334 n=1 Tax=Saccostrea cuccullata TaxID=36930 RepID=UPI002ED4B7A6
MAEEGATPVPVGTTMQNWLAGTIVGTMAVIVLSIFIPGWIVFTDINSSLSVSASIYYWMVCGARNTSCGAHGVGQPEAYMYIEKTNATPDTTLLLVSVDMIICIMCAVIVLGDMAGNQPKTTWWNNLKLAILIFIIFVLNLVILGLFGHSSITLSAEPSLVVNVPYSLFILSLAVLLALLEFCFLIYIHRVSTAPYRTVPSTSIEEEDQPSTSQPSINRPC